MIFRFKDRFMFALVCACVITGSLHAEQLTINLSSGTVVVVEAPDQAIDWKTIDRKGDFEKVTINLSQVAKIDLTDRPASVQILRVKKLLSDLDSDEYHVRVAAQNELSQPTVGRRFKELIEAELTNDSLEVRSRVRQVLKSFEKASEIDKPEYDLLYLKDGRVLVGDVGEFVLKCKYRDQDLSLKREFLRRITKTVDSNETVKEGPVFGQMLHRHIDDFFKNPDRFIDFETDQQGNELKSGAEVSQVFSSRGVIFEAEAKDYIGVSGFPLKFQDFPTGGNSVCPIDQSGGYTKKFRGVIRISFCKPGLPDAPAAVHEFGLFASRIDNPRDLILEAYNADSQMIACVEATDQAMVFLGVRSNQPIAFVRVLSNPYLFDVTRRIDETYVIDHVWFGEPVGLDDAKLARVGDQLGTLVLQDGSILSVEDIRFTDNGVQVFEPQMKRRMTFSMDEVHSVRFGVQQKLKLVSNTSSQLRMPNPASDRWAVMLDDGSVLAATPGETFRPELLEDVELGEDQVVGFWAMRDHLRFPIAGDFEKGKHVLVFPTCRIATEVKLADNEVSWKKGSKIEQPIFAGEPTEDVTPQFNRFVFDRRLESQMPTVWLRKPSVGNPDWGSIDLVDGQKIVLGSENGFSIQSMNDQQLTIVGMDGVEVRLPMAQVYSIKFPK